MTGADLLAGKWRQLALPFTHEPQFAAADFIADYCNDDALAFLAPGIDWPQHRLALWGGEGCGKTHLLHVWATRAGATIHSGPSLPHAQALPDRPIAVDDADAAAELRLLHLLNAAAEAGQRVLLAGRLPPARWPTALPDLASRLRAITAVEIRPPDDDMLRVLLLRLLSERQVAVPEAVQEWLLKRLPRTPGAVREVAARLDRGSLAVGGPVTREIAARALHGFGAVDGSVADIEDFAATPSAICPTSPCLL